MNPYLLFFTLYALGIARLTVRMDFGLGRTNQYRLQVFLAGTRIWQHQLLLRNDEHRIYMEQENIFSKEMKESELTSSILSFNPTLFKTVFDKRLRKMIRRLVHWQKGWIDAKLGFPNAAANALCYGALSVAAHVLRCFGVREDTLAIRAVTDFSGMDGQVSMGGILQIRLGSLALVTAWFAIVHARISAAAAEQDHQKEEQYAAASH